MSEKFNLDDVQGGYDLSVINNNFDKIEKEFNEKILYRDNPEGEPNYLSQDLDLNGYRLFNVGDVLSQGGSFFDRLENEYNTYIQDMQNVYEDFENISSRITVSTNPPSGGEDGDIWFRLDSV